MNALNATAANTRENLFPTAEPIGQQHEPGHGQDEHDGSAATGDNAPSIIHHERAVQIGEEAGPI